MGIAGPARYLPRVFFRKRSLSWLVCIVLVLAIILLPNVEDEALAITHIVIVSSTYFHNSSGYDLNTMVTLYTAEKPFTHTLSCWSRNETDTLVTHGVIKHTSIYGTSCRWTSYLVTCQVALQPNEFALSATEGIPYRHPRNDTISTVACFNPLFYYEDWQQIIVTLELYRQYGTELQVYYVQSMLADILDLIQVYQARGYAKVEPWHKVDIRPYGPSTYDMNVETERGNQPGAHTDCLLYYKDAAEFIIFADVGDILTPARGLSFTEEFRWFAAEHPLAAGFVYSRQQAILPEQSSDKFRLDHAVANSSVVNEQISFKTIVRPQRVKSHWIHLPGMIEGGYNLHPTFREASVITHFEGHRTARRQSFAKNTSQKVVFAHAELLDRNMQSFFDQGGHRELLSVTQVTHYQSLLEECYNIGWYDVPYGLMNCPSPSRCQLSPATGVKCAVAQRQYINKQIIPTLMIHYPQSQRGFELRYDGCN